MERDLDLTPPEPSHNGSAVGAPMAQPPRYSGYALASILVSLAFMCPFACVLGPLIGLRALLQIRANPSLRGRGIARAAIVIGLVALLGWVSFAYMAKVGIRDKLLAGPIAPDVTPESLLQQFTPGLGEASLNQARDFLSDFQQRFGPVDHFEINQADDPPTTPTGEFPVSYLVHASFGNPPAQALFIPNMWPPNSRFRWIRIIDPQRGDLIFPPDRRDEALQLADAWATASASAP